LKLWFISIDSKFGELKKLTT